MKRSLAARVAALEKEVASLKRMLDSQAGQAYNEDMTYREAMAAAGKKGGPARAAKLSKEQRQEIAKKAAAARWSKQPKQAE